MIPYTIEMTLRRTEKIELISPSPGTKRFINVHRWGTQDSVKAYVQASLHADEIPGLLVSNHLSKLLDDASSRQEIIGEVIIVPFANPIGLSQQILGHHVGRFCFESGVNFNRSYYDCTESVSTAIADKLTSDPSTNVQIIREELLRQIDMKQPLEEDEYLKKVLLRISSQCDIVLDLHCDCDAVMHMYTHTKLWPRLSDLCEEIGSKCQIVDSNSGGNCFDEANCNLWSNLAERFPTYPIPMACEATTVELRGEADVSLTSLCFLDSLLTGVRPLGSAGCPLHLPLLPEARNYLSDIFQSSWRLHISPSSSPSPSEGCNTSVRG
jgi:uncharacterized protein